LPQIVKRIYRHFVKIRVLHSTHYSRAGGLSTECGLRHEGRSLASCPPNPLSAVRTTSWACTKLIAWTRVTKTACTGHRCGTGGPPRSVGTSPLARQLLK